MKIHIYKLASTGLCLFLFIILPHLVFGQKSGKCEVKNLPEPKMKIASKYSTEIIGLRVAVRPKYQTDVKLILTARYIKQKHCEKKSIIVFVFDNKKDAREFTVYGVKKIPDTLRAIYSFEIDSGKEELVRIKVINNIQVETPIKLNE